MGETELFPKNNKNRRMNKSNTRFLTCVDVPVRLLLNFLGSFLSPFVNLALPLYILFFSHLKV
jgi:hypothetical protein